MDLPSQFQAFLGSVVLGMFFVFLYQVFNRIFFRLHATWIRFFFESLFFLLLAYLYFRFLFWVCYGKLNLHYLLALGIGAFIYLQFYSPFILRFMEEKNKKIKNSLFPMLSFLKKRYNKLKARKGRKKYGRRKKEPPHH